MTGLHMKYFVLKPEGSDAYAAASRKAMRVYARYIRAVNAKLADDLDTWANSLTPMLQEDNNEKEA